MSSDWLEVLKHLFGSISKRLVLLLQNLQSNVVGISWPWHYVAKDNEQQLQPCSKVSSSSNHRPPLLLIHTSEKFKWALYNVLENKFIDLQLRLPMKRFCGCSKGWLICLERDFTVTLINPFSRVKGSNKNSIIHLPKLDFPDLPLEAWNNRKHYLVYKATISADPSLDAKNCIVTVICEGSLRLAFLRFGKDTKWTYTDRKMAENVVHIDEKHYCVDGYGKLMAFDSNNHQQYIAPPEKKDRYPRLLRQTYLVDSVEKELLMVHRYICYRGSKKHKTKFFRIYEFSFHDGKWIKKKSLGDVALFIGDNSSISVLASDFLGCRPNCIYFNHDNDRITCDNVPSHDYGAYNVESEEISQPYTMYAKKYPPIWIVPPSEAS